jgi:hypothetical protein
MIRDTVAVLMPSALATSVSRRPRAASADFKTLENSYELSFMAKVIFRGVIAVFKVWSVY